MQQGYANLFTRNITGLKSIKADDIDSETLTINASLEANDVTLSGSFINNEGTMHSQHGEFTDLYVGNLSVSEILIENASFNFVNIDENLSCAKASFNQNMINNSLHLD